MPAGSSGAAPAIGGADVPGHRRRGSETATDDGGFDPRWLGKSIPWYHWHFHRRLLARYGIVLAPGDFAQLVKDIRKGRAVLVEERPHGRAIYSVRIKSLQERIYVMVAGRHVVTAYPPKRGLNDRRRLITDEIWLRRTGSPPANAESACRDTS